ncbi:MAG: calcium/sodium antiporter [Polyangiales bacterium]
MLAAALLIGGAVLLYLGAEWFVGGAASLARSLGVPQLLVGLTVVAYGTSAPEAVVAAQAALNDHAAMALGNVVGSNIANIGLILGLSVLVRPAAVPAGVGRREVPIMVATALAVPLAVWLDGGVRRVEGALFLLAAVTYTAAMVRAARGDMAREREARRAASVEAHAADAAGAPSVTRGRGRSLLVALAGAAMLVLGGRWFVDGATRLALAVGMSERMVGLTVVAVGTSLPELATSLVASRRGHGDIAVGNVLGSNVFNVLLCLGLAACVRPIAASLRASALDLGVMVGLTLVAAAMLRAPRTPKRWEGAACVGLYAAFLAALAAKG